MRERERERERECVCVCERERERERASERERERERKNGGRGVLLRASTCLQCVRVQECTHVGGCVSQTDRTGDKRLYTYFAVV